MKQILADQHYSLCEQAEREDSCDFPTPSVTVRESIAAMSDADRQWMIEHGYLRAQS
jgi:hypothetical protein